MFKLSLEDRNRFQHELRTPLTIIFGMVFLLRDEKLSIAQKKYIENILSSAKALLNFVNELELLMENENE